MIVSVVPDVSGIDKVFDYAVPHGLESSAVPGSRVRIPLHGRVVPGWIVRAGSRSDMERDHLVPADLSSLESVAGVGVDPGVVELARDIAVRWHGPLRAVLASATSPRVRESNVSERHGPRTGVPAGSAAFEAFVDGGGGLIVVPPLSSALGIVASLARRGSVLVVCPTHRMARLGAAWLRRLGLTTAEMPDEWERAAAGVDIVIGARSTVLAPCAGLAAVVVIDEHDDALKEERVPVWEASEVAVMRGERAGVPVVLTSPVPSARTVLAMGNRTLVQSEGPAWPRIVVEDLGELPAPSSLLGENLLRAARSEGSSVACILTTKGGAKVLVCEICRAMQRCPGCASLLSRSGEGPLSCPRCGDHHGFLCLSCGRPRLRALRGGHSMLARDVERSTGRVVVEVSSTTTDKEIAGRIIVGTETVLHRFSGFDTVVLCDIDRDLGAPRIDAPREFLAVAARAARSLGRGGTLVLQTRQPGHPLVRALVSDDPVAALHDWSTADLASRRALGLPPYGCVVRVTYPEGESIPSLVLPEGVDRVDEERGFLLRALDRFVMDEAVETVRATTGSRPRVVVDPRRY